MLVPVLLVVASVQPARAELGKQQVRKVIKANISGFEKCLEKALPNLGDHTSTVTFTIAPNGRVTKSVGTGNPAIDDCLADWIRSLRFPTSLTSTEVKYPFTICLAGN